MPQKLELTLQEALRLGMRLLREDALDCNLELVAFTNEEYLPIGDDTYLERRGEGFLDRVLMAINFDGPGHILDVNSLASFTCMRMSGLPDAAAFISAALAASDCTSSMTRWSKSPLRNCSMAAALYSMVCHMRAS